MRNEFITLAHGSGGAESASLMREIFAKRFNNEILGRLEDSAVVSICVTAGAGVSVGTYNFDTGSPVSKLYVPTDTPPPRLAVSTDTFVVTPLFFPGGDIGKLAVCGTVNDVMMSGAKPLYLTCGFVIEAGLSISELDRVCESIASAAREAGVTIIAGDTKVIEGHSEGGGLIINTTGIGVIPAHNRVPAGAAPHSRDVPFCASANIADAQKGTSLLCGTSPLCAAVTPDTPSPSGVRPGDAILVTGTMGDHHAAILSARMGIKNSIRSDCALLAPVISALNGAGVSIHSMRDVTRGGLGTILNELAGASNVSIEIEEGLIPVNPEVRSFCGIMGLDPLYMGNEGKMVLAVAPEDSDRALACIRETEIGRDAALIGYAGAHSRDVPFCASALFADAQKGTSLLCAPADTPAVTMRTRVGGTMRVSLLYGEGLPRIC